MAGAMMHLHNNVLMPSMILKSCWRCTKLWKYNEKDFEEAKLWDKYMQMYEDVFENCNAVPWAIVPADQNWYKEYVIAKTMVEGLTSLNMKYPQLKAGDQLSSSVH